MPSACPKCRTENADGSKFCRECAAPLPSVSVPSDESVATAEAPLRALSTGVTFAGRYRVIEELGEGGMGRVYKAFDTKIQEKIALKLVRPEIAGDRRVVQRFANEIRLARKITHRNVCRMYDLGDEQGTPYITMEYVSGEDLKSMLRMTGGLSPAQTVAIGRQIAAGLAEAHRLGVVHRDLKPHNVMIDREGTARIMDFGIAHSARTKGLTDNGAMVGTPEYMSPEQAEGEDLDARSDIYSLGAMLFEMATGRPPFQGRSALALAMKHKGEQPPDPSTINPRVPADLAHVILKCLEKDKTTRYPTAEALVEDLDRLAAGLPAATPALPSRRATMSQATPAGRRRLTAVGVIVAVLLLMVGLTTWWLLARRKPGTAASAVPVARNSIAIVGFANETGDSRFEHLRRAVPRLLMTSLENTGRFKVVTWERMTDILAQAGRKDVDIVDSEGGFEVCKRERIGYLVIGSVTKAGDVFAIDVKVLDAQSRALIKSVSSRGEGENSILQAQLDAIGREIVDGLAPSAGVAHVTPLIDVTTRSMGAYTAYLRGTDAYDRFRFDVAVRELKDAVDLDPQFAVAHLYLSHAYYGVGNLKERDEELRLAKQHAAKATERERMQIEAAYAAFIERNDDKNLALLNDLVTRYPDDKRAQCDLAFAYADHSMPAEAAAAYQRALDLDPNYGAALNGVAYVYLNLGKPDLATQCLQKYAAISPGDPNPIDSQADVQYRLGRFDEAAALWQRVLAIAPDFGSDLALATLAALKEDYDAALRWTDSAIRNAPVESKKADGYGLRAILLQLMARPDGARVAARECREIMAKVGKSSVADVLRGWIEFDNARWTESRKAFQDARSALQKQDHADRPIAICNTFLLAVDQAQGPVGESRARLEQFRGVMPAVQPGAARTFALNGMFSDVEQFCLELSVRRLHAGALVADGRIDDAISVLKPAWPGPVPPWYFGPLIDYYLPLAQDDLARLYAQKKDWDHGIAEYRMLTIIGPEHLNRRLVHPIYHFRFAQVLEQAGRTAEAIEQYERFLKLWAKADPGRAEITYAKARLAALRKSTA